MKVKYIEYTGNDPIIKYVDLEEFWSQWLECGIKQVNDNWKHHLETGELYCYGRNQYDPRMEKYYDGGFNYQKN